MLTSPTLVYCFPFLQATSAAAESWKSVLTVDDFPAVAPDYAELTEDEYIQYNVGKPCPSPGPGEEELALAYGWGTSRRFHALKHAANWY